jgi:hypothetical protein
MQTFVPEKSYTEIAKSLDKKRLFKNSLETMQIYKALTVEEYGWKNHPAVKMWRGHEHALLLYGYEMLKEAVDNRGVKSVKLVLWYFEELEKEPVGSSDLPEWWGRDDIHDSHRARLWQKDPVAYAQYERFGQTIDEYVWPVS